MKRAAVLLCLSAFATASAFALPQGFKLIKEFLTGYEEVPSVSTEASGQFNARISKDECAATGLAQNYASKGSGLFTPPL